MIMCDLVGRLGAAQMAMAEWEAAVAAFESGIALDPASSEMVSWCVHTRLFVVGDIPRVEVFLTTPGALIMQATKLTEARAEAASEAEGRATEVP